MMKKSINIYKGCVRLAKVSKVEMEDGKVKRFEYVRPIIKKDVLFYEGLRSHPVSFDYHTILPDEAEAAEIVKQDVKARKNPEKKPFPTCLYVNYDEVTPHMKVTRKQFRKLKKEYKEEAKKRSR